MRERPTLGITSKEVIGMCVVGGRLFFDSTTTELAVSDSPETDATFLLFPHARDANVYIPQV
jgi:hypothetical protein